MISPLILGGLSALLGAFIGYLVRQGLVSKRAGSVEGRLKAKVEAAEVEAKHTLHTAQVSASAILEFAQRDERERKTHLSRLEDRLVKMQESLDRELKEVLAKDERAKAESLRAEEATKVAEVAKAEALSALQKVSGMTPEEAKAKIFAAVTEESRVELALTIQKLQKERREEIERKSTEIIVTALQRYGRAHAAEFSTSSFALPSEDMKGKIIGREGRNIRTLERLTGVEIMLDEQPMSVTISSFDPMRRELARMALEKLMKDGRIQPAKIEEAVEKSREELAKRVEAYGEDAAYELGIMDFPKEVLQILGRLHFRTSYGQNILDHSVEMAHVAGMLAAELGLNVELSKRGALVHDIGKAIDHEVQGTHVEIGRKILKKYGVDEAVIRAMESHHDEYPYSIPEAYVVAAADAISGARPGARRDNLEHYIKRLADLERIATEVPGVQMAYALSAGREIRVFVTPEKVDDFGALQMAKDIAHRIQAELKYPGEIKVNVIREVRAVEYAK